MHTGKTHQDQMNLIKSLASISGSKLMNIIYLTKRLKQQTIVSLDKE